MKWTTHFNLPCPTREWETTSTEPGHRHPETFKLVKQTVVRIQNEDVLCCAYALVTAKAKVDLHPKWNSIRQGRRRRTRLVPFGPCSNEELAKFSLAPSLYEYQILLVDADRAYHVSSFGPPATKQLILLQDKGHYDVITSLPGFFGTSYVCAHCFTSYNDEGRHRWQAKLHCHACLQKECPEFFDDH